MTAEQWYWISTPRATFGIGATNGIVTGAAPIAWRKTMGLPIAEALALYPGAEIVPLIDWAARKERARAFLKDRPKRGHSWTGKFYDYSRGSQP